MLFGPGLRGEIAETVQQSLLAAGFDPRGVDGFWGKDTTKALRAFQAARALPISGVVDDATWQPLTGQPVPGLETRCLSLTAAIEGHGYSLALGNFDGAWLTWGIIGFTLKHGKVEKIILQIHQTKPELLEQAFGEQADELVAIMRASDAEQQAWANENTDGSSLREPWRSGFARLGEFPFVRDLQRTIALEDYFKPALHTAQRFNLSAELGIALCFDIHVQNGGVKPEAEQRIRDAVSVAPPATELALREIMANAVAEVAKPKWREDVRKRKLAIARGRGVVHGMRLELENWGLADLPAVLS
jgi:hypothetical protein